MRRLALAQRMLGAVSNEEGGHTLLAHALIRSMHGIARRRKQIGKTSFEYHFAVISDKGIVHLLNGRNHSIRRLDSNEPPYLDWEPFQEVPLLRRRKMKVKKVDPVEK